MIYNDYGLINRDGSINLQYAFEWMETLKEKYDMREILQDMEDIEWLLRYAGPVRKERRYYAHCGQAG